MIHPKGRPVALFLTDIWKLRSSNSVKTKAYSYAFMYICPSHLRPIGASSKDMTPQK